MDNMTALPPPRPEPERDNIQGPSNVSDVGDTETVVTPGNFGHLAVVEVWVPFAVKNHGVVAHHEKIAAQVVQRHESARHDASFHESQIHGPLDDL